MELYVALKLVWALLLGILLIGLGVMVGMDMGVGTLLRFVGKTDGERRAALNIIGPHWDGNQVWFILGGGRSSPPSRPCTRPRSRFFTS